MILDKYINKAVEKKLAEKAKSELGTTGTQIYYGTISGEEYNADLSGTKMFDIYDKMVRTDAQVKASMLAVWLPVRSATWVVEPASQDNQDILIAEDVESQLFDGAFSWNHKLAEILRYLQYGFYPFEKVYALEDSRYTLKKLAPRKPKTIQRFYQDDSGDLESVEQWAYFPGGTYKTVRIPAEKILLFTHDQEGDNYMGTSLLRSAYRNWFLKDTLLKIDAIKHDRLGTGMPHIHLPEQATNDDIDAAESVGETFRTHEKGYIITVGEQQFEILDMKGKAGSDLMRSIKYHDTEIVSNILAQFLQMGKTETGARAVTESLRDVFLLSLQSIVNYIEDVFNVGFEGRTFIPEYVHLNYANVTQYPKLRCSNLQDVNYDVVAQTLATLVDKKIVQPDNDLEDFIREKLDLPERNEESIQERKPMPLDLTPKEDKEEEEEPKDVEACGCGEIHLADPDRPFTFWRPMNKLEKQFGMDAVRDRLNDFREKAFDIGDSYRIQIIKAMTEKGKSLLASHAGVKDTAAKMDKYNVPLQGKFASELIKPLRETFDYGKGKIKQELVAQDIKLQDELYEDESEARKAVRPKVEMAIGLLAMTLLTEWKREILAQKADNEINSQRLYEVLDKLSLRTFKDEMRKQVNQNYGLGRMVEARKHKDKITKIIRSEIMDENICNECVAIDGEEFTADSAFSKLFRNEGYVNCEGTADRCRGTHFYMKG